MEPPEHEAGETFVLFEVAEGRFHLYWPCAAVPQAFFTGEQLAGLGLQLVQPMVHLDDPVAFGFVAGTVQWAACAVVCLVARYVLWMTGFGG